MFCRAEFDLQTPVQVFGDRLSVLTGIFCGSTSLWGGQQVRSGRAGCKLLMPHKLSSKALLPRCGGDGALFGTGWSNPLANPSDQVRVACSRNICFHLSLQSVIRNEYICQHPVVPLYFGGL